MLAPARHNAALFCARLCVVLAAFLLVMPSSCSALLYNKTSSLSIPSPSGVAIDSAGNVYGLIGLNATIMKWNSTGHLLSSSAVIPNNPASTTGLIVDACGQQYVADDTQNVLWKVHNAAVQQLAVPGFLTSLYEPQGVWVDGSGAVWTADYENGRLVVFAQSGLVANTFSINQTDFGGPSYPLAVATDSAGFVYIIVDDFVVKQTATGEELLVFDSATPSLSSPGSVFVDRFGNVYVSDSGNARVVQFNATGGVVAYYQAVNPALGSTGQVSVDLCGTVRVTDPSHNRIVSFVTNASCSDTTIALPIPSYCTATPPPLFEYLSVPSPVGVAVDAQGDVYGLGTDGTVLEFSPSGQQKGVSFPLLGSSPGLNGLVVDACGQQYITLPQARAVYQFNGSTQQQLAVPPFLAALSSPQTPWVDASGTVWVPDYNNQRIVTFSQTGLVSGLLTNPAISNPVAVATDSAGNVYVVNSGSSSVIKLNAAGTSLLATFTASVPGPALSNPSGITIDRYGSIYITDSGNARVVQLNSTGGLINSFYTPPPFLNNPNQVTVDDCGNVYVADYYNSRIVEFVTNSSCALSTVQPALPAYCTAPASPPIRYFATAQPPQGVAVDAAGNVYSSSEDGSVTQYSSAGQQIGVSTPIGGNEAIYSLFVDPCEQLYVTGTSSAVYKLNRTALLQLAVPGFLVGLNNPTLSWVDASGTAWVADSYNQRIVKFSQTGLVTGIITNAAIYYPISVATDSAGNIYVLNGQGENSVVKLNATGTKLLATFTAAVPGPGLSGPSGMTIDRYGSIYITDSGNARVVQLNSTGGLINSFYTPPPFLNNPNQVTVDDCGNVYVADYYNSRIVEFVTNSSCALSTVQPALPAYCTAPASPPIRYFATAQPPQGVAVDAAGNVYSSNSPDGSQLVFSPAGLQTIAPPVQATERASGPVLDLCGQQYYTTSGVVWKLNNNGSLVLQQLAVPPFLAALSSPQTPWVDASGTVWVPDYNNQRIVTFSQTGLVSGLLTNPAISNPVAVATDSAGNVYVVNSGSSSVIKLNAAGTSLLATFTASVPGPALSNPSGITIDRYGSIYITDSGNARVVQLNSTGGLINSFYTPPPFLNNPNQVTVDDCGNVYVADYYNSRIVEFVTNSSCALSTVQPALPAYCTAPASPPIRYFATAQPPQGVAVDAAGNVYSSSEDGSVTQYSSAGQQIGVSTPIGGNEAIYSLFVDPCEQLYVTGTSSAVYKLNRTALLQLAVPGFLVGLNNPTLSWVDASGTAWVADSYNQRIVKFSQTGLVTGIITNAAIYYPISVATDSAGNIYVLNGQGENSVVKLNATGTKLLATFTAAVPGPGLSGPSGMTIDRYGSIYITDSGNARVVQLNSTGGLINSFYTPPPFLNNPNQVTVDDCGNVYVADYYNSRIVEFVTNSSCALSTVQPALPAYCTAPASPPIRYFATAQPPQGVAVDAAGNVYSSSEDGSVTQYSSAGQQIGVSTPIGGNEAIYSLFVDPCEQLYVTGTSSAVYKLNRTALLQLAVPGFLVGLNNPTLSWVDASGTAWVADSYNQRIVKFSQTGLVTGIITNAAIYYPISVATDSAGNIYVLNGQGENSVVKLNATGTKLLATFTAAVPGPGLSGPSGMTIDRYGSIYITDSGNARVVQLNSTGGLINSFYTPPPFLNNPNQVTVDDCGNVYVG